MAAPHGWRIGVLLSAACASLALQNQSADFVELDIAVLGRDGSAVTDLQQKDFTIKEDGKPVEIKTFTPVSADGLSADSARQIVMLLDDTLPLSGTTVIQQMAQSILSRARLDDEVTVVRLHNDRDEPFGDLETALSRIGGYRAATVPFQRRSAADRVFKVLTGVARHLENVEHRRKLFVCIGGPNVCNILEPLPLGYSQLWPGWVGSLAAASRANLAVYAVMPVPPGSIVTAARGLVDYTGGSAFFNTSSFDAYVDGLWREASQYYLAGYWPTPSKRELRDVQVKVARKGVRVRHRSKRG